MKSNILGGGRMFQVGDQVFCPMRGSGIVEAIEDRLMLDQVKEYFIIQLQSSNMTIMVPIDKVALSRFRHISDAATADRVLATLAERDIVIDDTVPVKQRLKNNQVKLSAGTLDDCAQVVRDLTHIQKEKPLNAGERAMLMDSRKLLLDEITMIKDLSKEDATAMIDELLG